MGEETRRENRTEIEVGRARKERREMRGGMEEEAYEAAGGGV